MMTNREIKSFARRQLRGNWGSMIGSFFLLLLAALLFIAFPVAAFAGGAAAVGRFGGMLSERDGMLLRVSVGILVALLFLLYYLIATGLALGMQRMYLDMVRGRRVSASDIFRGFRNGRQFWSFFWVELLLGLMSLVISAPLFLCMYVYGLNAANTTIVRWITNAISFLLQLFFAGAPIFAADDPNRSAVESLLLSFHTMERRKGRYLLLILSFFPWYLLSAVTLGLGMLFLVPYITAAETIFFLSAYSEDRSAKS